MGQGWARTVASALALKMTKDIQEEQVEVGAKDPEEEDFEVDKSEARHEAKTARTEEEAAGAGKGGMSS